MVRSSSAKRFCAEYNSTGTFTRPKLIAPFHRPRGIKAVLRALARQAPEDRHQVVGVLLFLRQDLFQHAPRGRILVAEVGDHLAVAVDGDPLGDQVLLDHLLERAAFDVLGVAARGEAIGREVRRAAELHDARGDLVGVLLLLRRVLEKLRRHALGMDALRHEVMALVAQRADDLGGERFVQELQHHAAVGVIPGSHRPLGDVLAGALAQRLDVGEKRSAHFEVLPVAALRSFDANRALMSALARSYFALASFSQALSSLPFATSHFSLATLYSCSALASSTLRACESEGSYFCSSSALATLSLPLPSASQISFSWPFIGPHFALAALQSASMRAS